MFDVRINPAPSLAPRRTRAPFTIMQRDPMKQSSSDHDRRGLRRLEHATDPDAARQVHRLPICAHDPTVAQVSTIVPSSTYAPMFT